MERLTLCAKAVLLYFFRAFDVWKVLPSSTARFHVRCFSSHVRLKFGIVETFYRFTKLVTSLLYGFIG